MLPFHPYADLFPLIEGAEFDDLVADVKANDLREKIVVWDGAILDGRNRYRAGLAAGLIEDDDGPDRAKYFVRFVPAVDGDPLGFVISKNLKRRHLDESQRAMVAARLANLPAHRPGADDKSANLPTSQPEAARKLSISERALRHARRVQDHGAPELVRAVERGRLAVSVAERATHLSADIQRKIAAEAEAGNQNTARNVVKQEARGERERDLANKLCALRDTRYGVIYADPEWRFEVYSRDTGMDRSADNHYPTSATEAICARPVATIAAGDCVLFLWATVPMLPDALKVMDAWGFTYKSHCIWTKDKVGTGYWFRNAHELLLVGTRGNVPAPAMGTQWPSTIEARTGAHSAKPDRFYELIEDYFPNLPKIELNARRRRAGWDAWGLEAPTDAAGNTLDHDPDTGEIATDTGAAMMAGFGVGVAGDIEKSQPEPSLPEHDATPPAGVVEPASVVPSADAGSLPSHDMPDIPEALRRARV